MTAMLQVVRTVRRLTDGEPPSERREIGGYLIEAGIPVPPANKGRLKGKLTRALNALAVGESLVNPGGGRLNKKTKERLAPKEFTERKVLKGYRIWRTR